MRLSRFPLVHPQGSPRERRDRQPSADAARGMIKRLASGLYSWLPLGLRVQRKVERIVREEMDATGALELLMPVVQPAELWEESGRWDQFGPELLRLQDRHERDFCLGPTHEEVISDIARQDLRSYRQLPVNYYQIQTKFRDEVRPRFGVMRSREFVMKDAYSFHLDQASLEETYQAMYQAYANVCERMGLRYRAVEADTGAIGGSTSHEFHVLADSGEDAIAFSETGATTRRTSRRPPRCRRPANGPAPASRAGDRWPRPDVRTIEELESFLDVAAADCVKTLLVEGEEGGLVALLVRGDHELNALKAEKLPGVAAPLRMADGAAIRAETGCEPGFIGPRGLELPGLRRPRPRRAGGFRLRRQRERRASHRRQLGAGRAVAGCSWIFATSSQGDPSPDGEGHAQAWPGGSRSATYSSSATSTARRWAPRCSMPTAATRRCSWAATASASPASSPPRSSRTTTTAASSGRMPSPPSPSPSSRSTCTSRRVSPRPARPSIEALSDAGIEVL